MNGLAIRSCSVRAIRRRPGRMVAVRAKVKGWEIIDGEEESLADPERGGGWVRFMVGIDEGPGDESFDVLWPELNKTVFWGGFCGVPG